VVFFWGGVVFWGFLGVGWFGGGVGVFFVLGGGGVLVVGLGFVRISFFPF